VGITDAGSFALLFSASKVPGFGVFAAWMPSTRSEFVAKAKKLFVELPTGDTTSTANANSTAIRAAVHLPFIAYLASGDGESRMASRRRPA
jgi:hypothetical protein